METLVERFAGGAYESLVAWDERWESYEAVAEGSLIGRESQSLDVAVCARRPGGGRETGRQDSRHLWPHSTQVNSRTS